MGRMIYKIQVIIVRGSSFFIENCLLIAISISC